MFINEIKHNCKEWEMMLTISKICTQMLTSRPRTLLSASSIFCRNSATGAPTRPSAACFAERPEPKSTPSRRSTAPIGTSLRRTVQQHVWQSNPDRLGMVQGRHLEVDGLRALRPRIARSNALHASGTRPKLAWPIEMQWAMADLMPRSAMDFEHQANGPSGLPSLLKKPA